MTEEMCGYISHSCGIAILVFVAAVLGFDLFGTAGVIGLPWWIGWINRALLLYAGFVCILVRTELKPDFGEYWHAQPWYRAVGSLFAEICVCLMVALLLGPEALVRALDERLLSLSRDSRTRQRDCVAQLICVEPRIELQPVKAEASK